MLAIACAGAQPGCAPVMPFTAGWAHVYHSVQFPLC